MHLHQRSLIMANLSEPSKQEFVTGIKSGGSWGTLVGFLAGYMLGGRRR